MVMSRPHKTMISLESRRKMSIAKLGNKIMLGRHLSEETKKKLSLCNLGKNHPQYGKYRSKSTKEKISKALSGRKLSTECKIKVGNATKERWKNKIYREKTLKAIMKGCKILPNRPESLLLKLLNINYQYVGDGKIIIGGFNPDFINEQDKKIIECYGDYWHNLLEYKLRDKKRLIAYKSLGYKTLIIWEYELKNLKKLMDKIKKFNEN